MPLPTLRTKFTEDEREALELYELITRFAALAPLRSKESLRLAEEYITYELGRDHDAQPLVLPIQSWLRMLMTEK